MARLLVLLGLAAVQLSGRVEGHGVVQIPSSRSWECISAHNKGNNEDCEIRTVWGTQNYGRFPDSGPTYGNIASAGNAAKTVLDEQSSTRWWKNAMTSGSNEFRWLFRDGANHETDDFKYFITVEEWNPNTYLHANAFEAEPFCEFALGGERPPMILNHTCDVPYRVGYNVILALWDGSNGRSFYQIIDADFGGEGGGGGGASAVGLLSLENYNNVAESTVNSGSPYYGQGTGPQYLVPVGLPTMPERPDSPIGQTIWITASSGGYVSVNDGSGLQTEDTPLSGTEKFDVVDAEDGYIALRAENGLYVCADRTLDRTSPPLVADREELGSWEKFQWVSLGPYSMALKAGVNGKYVQVSGEALSASTNTQVAFSWGTTSW